MTTREAILNALVAMLAQSDALPPAVIDEPEPSRWVETPVAGGPGTLLHALAVQDDTPETLAFVRGAVFDEAGEELEFTPVIAYAVQIKPVAGMTQAQMRAARRTARDAGVQLIADLIRADRTLGLDAEVCAEIGSPARDDEVAFPNALPSATALIPVRVLYTGRDAAS